MPGGTKTDNSVASFTDRASCRRQNKDGGGGVAQGGGRGLPLMGGCSAQAVAQLLRGGDDEHGYRPACLAALARARRRVQRSANAMPRWSATARVQATAARPAWLQKSSVAQ